jgi:hypothetical protein
MKKTEKRRRERVMFAAPIVATAVFAAGCPSRTYHENPGGPVDVPPDPKETPEPTETAQPDTSPTAAPTASASAAPTTGELQDPPKDGGGEVVAQKDGTCLYVFPDPKMDCPPTARCNPGPPREPLRVKCPDGKKP